VYISKHTGELKKMNVIEIPIVEIVMRKKLMPRDGIKEAVVEDYRASIEFLPPIKLGIDDGQNVLLDGWHRLLAYKAEGKKTIPAIVDSTIAPEDFYFEAAKANRAHGQRLTATEKRTVSRNLFLKENRSVAEISVATGISERHVRRLVESFNEARKELAREKAGKLAQKKNPDTGKKYTVREIAAILTDDGFDTTKSSVSRWLKDDSAEAEEPVIEAETVEDDDVEEEEEIQLPKRDKQSSAKFMTRMMETIEDVDLQMKKVKSLTYSAKTLDKIGQLSSTLMKKAADLNDLCLDMTM